MTGAELLKALSITGEVYEADFHDGLCGYFGWSVGFENGDAVLTVRFEDPEAPILDAEKKWVLTPVEARGGKRV